MTDVLPVDTMTLAVVAGVAFLALVALVAVLRRRGNADARESRRSHEAAQEREPPVELGETVELAVQEFSTHHSGEEHAMGRVQGFVIFVEDVPCGVEAGDVIRATVLSFNRGHTSATASYEGRA